MALPKNRDRRLNPSWENNTLGLSSAQFMTGFMTGFRTYDGFLVFLSSHARAHVRKVRKTHQPVITRQGEVSRG